MQETEKKDINLLDFQKVGKSGVPYEILDDKIAEYITQTQLNMFIMNGVPYLYRRGVYRRDEDGKILKAHIKALIWPELVTISRINRVYGLILADYRLTKSIHVPNGFKYLCPCEDNVGIGSKEYKGIVLKAGKVYVLSVLKYPPLVLSDFQSRK